MFGCVKSAGSSTALSIYITATANCFKELLSLALMTVLNSDRTELWETEGLSDCL